MKNIILIVVDGLKNREIGDAYKTPFINVLAQNGIYATKAYSQGPYTEAAIMSLLYNGETFDNGGYYSGMLNSKNNLVDIFADCGYDIFIPFWWQIFPASSLKKTKWKMCDLRFSGFLEQKLRYYNNLNKLGKLDTYDMQTISIFLDCTWEIFDLIIEERNDLFRTMASKDVGLDVDTQSVKIFNEWCHKVKSNKQMYLRDKKKYINGIFDDYSKHFLLSECNLDNFMVRKDVRDNINKAYRMYAKKIKINRIKYMSQNVHRMHLFINHAFQYFMEKNPEKKKIQKDFLFSFYYEFLMRIFMWQFEYAETYRILSGKSIVNMFEQWITERTSKSPYFAYLHFDDRRNCKSITGSCDNIIQTNDEVNAAIECMDTLLSRKGYHGDLQADLSLKYLDDCVKKLYETIEKRNDFDNTIIIFTSDHGKTDALIDGRTRAFNNFFDDTYHIPMIICGKDIEPRRIDKFVMSSDLFTTIAEFGNVDARNSGVGTSLLNLNCGREFVTVEYGGPGVPDLRRRPLILGYRDNEVNIVYEVNINGKFEDGKIVEIYDLTKDPKEKNNLVLKNDYDEKKIREKIEPLRGRFEVIKTQYIL